MIYPSYIDRIFYSGKYSYNYFQELYQRTVYLSGVGNIVFVFISGTDILRLYNLPFHLCTSYISSLLFGEVSQLFIVDLEGVQRKIVETVGKLKGDTCFRWKTDPVGHSREESKFGKSSLSNSFWFSNQVWRA